MFTGEIEDAFSIFIKYWIRFADARNDVANKEVETADLLQGVFGYAKDQDFIDSVIADYKLSGKYKKDKAPSLQIRDVRSLYHTSPERSGVTITNENGTTTTYEGIVPTVSVGDAVKNDDQVGKLAGEELTLTTMGGSGYMDSLDAGEILGIGG